jgi:hypothetical protein
MRCRFFPHAAVADGCEPNLLIARGNPFERAPEPGPLYAGGSTVRPGDVAQAVLELGDKLAVLDGIINQTRLCRVRGQCEVLRGRAIWQCCTATFSLTTASVAPCTHGAVHK